MLDWIIIINATIKIFAPLAIVALLLIHFKKWVLALIVCLFTLLISLILWFPCALISMPLMGYYIYKRKKQNKLDEEQIIIQEKDREHRENIRYIAERMRAEEKERVQNDELLH